MYTKPFLCNFRGLRYLQNKMGFFIRWFWSKHKLFDSELPHILKTIMIKTVLTSIQSVWVTHYETVRIWIDVFQNHFLFCKFLSPLISHRNGFVFEIFVWVSVFRRKKLFENPMLGCWEICKINTAPFFFKHPVSRWHFSRQHLSISGISQLLLILMLTKHWR